ncbi:hypothetical protein MRX96_009263 [Rhipicephalus microplus]
MTSSESATVPPQTPNQITNQQRQAAMSEQQQQTSSQQQATTNHQHQSASDRPHAAPAKAYRNRVAVTRSISLLNYTSSGHRIDYRRHRPISQLAFDLEDGPGGGGGRALLEASSPSGLVLSNFPPQRRESFLYRSDSEFEMSPKTSAVAPQTSAVASTLQRIPLSCGSHYVGQLKCASVRRCGSSDKIVASTSSGARDDTLQRVQYCV